VIGYNIDKHSHPVWICTTGEHEFKVKKKGTSADRLCEASIADKYIGQWLKIEYETLSKDNKPLKPVGIAWRSCDADGNPTE
ncbi:MAG: hypothetical protein J7L15_00540, partial [Clostridiales bacterium]|nr:hypothetical protein [Clostridiales bacterium]